MGSSRAMSEGRMRAMTHSTQSYWVIAHVILHTPMPCDDGASAVGYYRVLGLWSTDAELRDTLAAETADGVIDWDDTTCELRNISDIGDDVILKRVMHDQCVWFRSGRMFYP